MTIEQSVTDLDTKIGCKRKITDFFQVSKRNKSESNENGMVENGKLKDYENTKSEEKLEEKSEDENERLDSIPIDPSFDKGKFIESLTDEERDLLDLELNTMEDSWFELLYKEFTKPYFLNLKRFLKKEWEGNTTIFPPKEDIYSWTRLTPLRKVKVLIIGQDPYHNFNQAHGLAFSVKDNKTRIPPSLINIFKGIKIDYPEFQTPKNGNLTKWAKEGVLMLNTCLTVQAHKANSHSKHGWEEFTKAVVSQLISYNERLSSSSSSSSHGIVVIAWGKPAEKLVESIKNGSKKTNTNTNKNTNLYLIGAHPSPLSAIRGGFFKSQHFLKCNNWLRDHNRGEIKWQL